MYRIHRPQFALVSPWRRLSSHKGSQEAIAIAPPSNTYHCGSVRSTPLQGQAQTVDGNKLKDRHSEEEISRVASAKEVTDNVPLCIYDTTCHFGNLGLTSLATNVVRNLPASYVRSREGEASSGAVHRGLLCLSTVRNGNRKPGLALKPVMVAQKMGKVWLPSLNPSVWHICHPLLSILDPCYCSRGDPEHMRARPYSYMVPRWALTVSVRCVCLKHTLHSWLSNLLQQWLNSKHRCAERAEREPVELLGYWKSDDLAKAASEGGSILRMLCCIGRV